MRKRGERGNQLLEFSLIGIPLIFMMFSIANMSFSMLTMHTMQEACEQGARYIVTRGSTCSTGGNSCTATVQDIAGVIANSAAGISPSTLTVTLKPGTDSDNTISCSPLKSCLSSCSSGCNGSRTNTFPPSANSDNAPGSDITVSADATIASPIFMYWPSSGENEKRTSSTFHAYSRQMMMF